MLRISLALSSASLVCVFAASTASAGETGYAPPPNYAPAPTYAPPPNYAPAPAPPAQGYAPPPAGYAPAPPAQGYAPPPQGYAPAPQQQPYYGPPPQQQPYYGPPPGAYAPPPQPTYGYNRGGTFEIGRPGGVIAGVLGFGGYGSNGFGIGVQGGYSLPTHIYIGGAFTYFADTYGAYTLEVQGGYDLAVIPRVPLLIRPYGGLGYSHISTGAIFGVACSEAPDACTSSSGGAFVFSIGAASSYFFTRNWFAGVDLRLDITSSAIGYTGFDGFAMGGYKF